MKYRLMLLQWMVLATAMAAPQPAKPRLPDGNRFLFILETSAGMTRLEHGGRQAIFDLLYSGVDGRMQRGDTFGIWTFNGQVHAGIVPMQTYDPRTRLEQAATLGRYLRTHPYDKEGDFEALVKQIHAVVRGAKDVNIFVVTDGNTPFAGTAFDTLINAGFAANGTLVRESKKPLVVTLVARQSELIAACVTPAGEKIDLAELTRVTNSIPETTQTPAAQPTIERSATAVTNAPVIDMSRALIMRGPKTTNPPVAPVPPPTVAATTNETTTSATNAAPPVTTTSAPVLTKDSPAVAPQSDSGQGNEVRSSSTPEALPSFVPAQIKASARAVQPPISIIVPPTGNRGLAVPNLLLILGGAFVGASAVGAYLFMRKMRSRKEPSFISQGLNRY
jgi:hypothetical protein